MWQAIAYVSSGVTLLAFFAATAAWLYRYVIVQKERLIRASSEDQRAPLVELALEYVGIDPGTLTKAQRYEIAMRQIQLRAVRYRTAAVVIFLIALLTAIVGCTAMWIGNRTADSDKLREEIKSTTIKLEGLIDKVTTQSESHKPSIADKKVIDKANAAISRAARGYRLSVDNGPTSFVFHITQFDEKGESHMIQILDPTDRPALVRDALHKIADLWPGYDVDLPKE
jgi:hypothetical protein